MRRVLLLALPLAGGAALDAAAQVVAESTLTATISQSIEADTNYNLDEDSPGTTILGDTRIGLGLVQETDIQSLRFYLNTGLRALKEPDQDLEWVVASPSLARFAYEHDFANNAFDIDVRAASQRIDRLLLEEDPIFDDEGNPILPDDVTLIDDNTYQQRIDLDTGFAAGTNSPSTITFRLRASDIDYTGDSPEDFVPRTGAEGVVTWRLRFSPVLSSIVAAGYEYQKADDDFETEINNTEFDLGVVYQPSEELSVTVGGGYANRQERSTPEGGGPRTTEDNSGIALRLLADYEAEYLDFNLTTRYTNAAPSSRFAGDFRVRYDLPRGAITARAFQNYGLGSEGDDRRVTGIGLGYSLQVNSVSTLLFDFNAATSASADDPDDPADADDPDRSRLDFTAQYTRNFTQLVAASVGYTLTQRYEDPTDATSNRVFLQIGRSFVTGF
jgi:hypothetical protein